MPKGGQSKEIFTAVLAIGLAIAALAPYLAGVLGMYGTSVPLEPEQLLMGAMFTAAMGWCAVNLSRRPALQTAELAGPRVLRGVGLVLGVLAVVVGCLTLIYFLTMTLAMGG